ncbi:ferrous iron transport protein B [Methanocella sp. MCL-LM]|uniref:ferrous iron transport protein B n=1 Tax=Methanocella sp. MCL-LM TaxID=3412035 RepID=UPI003C71F083
MRPEKALKVALIGNPSVGKSTLFSRLTGIGVLISNYPGTTMEVAHGRVMHDEIGLDLTDLPGIYSLDTLNPEEKTVINYLKEEKPDIILNVIDSTRLERNLYLTLELLELDIPVIVALNMVDEAAILGMQIDHEQLAGLLGTVVIPTSAQKGMGLEELMHAFREPREAGAQRHVRYDRHVENYISQLKAMGLRRNEAVLLLSHGKVEGRSDEVATAVAIMRDEITSSHEAPVLEILAGNRYSEAGLISRSVMHHKPASQMSLRERIDDLLVSPIWGFIILTAAMLAMLLTVFFVGGFLEELIVGTFDQYILQPVTSALAAHPLIQVIVEYTLIGVQAGLGIVVPYIMTFYVLMALLENSGYLTRAAFLLDEIMHKFKLHGRAMIPMILGFGCSVPAIMSTKALQTRRERIITATLVCLVPCSARSIVILGLVASFVSIWAGLSIYVLMLIIAVVVAWILGRMVKGEEMGLVLEMVPLRVPGVKDVVDKTWMQMKEFIYVAFPLLIVGSAVLGVLQYVGFLGLMNSLLSPITTGWLGLPDFTATALIFGILRKEMALETLAIMAGTANFSLAMTPLQMYVFAVFTTIYMPCIASIAMLKRVLGWKDTTWITILTVILALIVSGLIAQLVPVIMSLI